MSEIVETVMKSATALGREFGLSGEEMNVALKLAGLQDGEPRAYWPTDKGLPFAVGQFRQRGPGGSGWYNRMWDWLTWDPAVVDQLDLSDEGIRQIRQVIADRRLELKAARETAAVARDAADVLRAAADNVPARSLDTKALAKVACGAAVVVGVGAAVTLGWRRWKQRRDRGDHGPEGSE